MGLLKLGGIASGLDTEGLIKTLMTLEKRPLVQLETRSKKLTSEAGAWRDLNQRLLTLQKRLGEVKAIASADWDGKKAAVADTSVITASAQSTATPGSYTVEVVSLATSTIWQSGLMGTGAVSDANADLGLAGTIKVATGSKAGQTFTIAATDSLNDIATNINAKKADLGFSASVVQVTPGDYRLVLTSSTGGASDFTLEDNGIDTAGAALMITSATGSKLGVATNGQLKVNGVSVAFENNTSVKDAVGGTTIAVLKTGTTTVNVTEDNSRVIGAVRSMVEQYNNVIDFIDGLTSYDTKTKEAGTLFGEDRVSTIESTLRARLLDPVKAVADEFESLGMVGISTESFKSGENVTSKLKLDATKFEAALEKNPNAVRDLFTLNNGVDKGLAVRATEWLDNYTKTGGILLGTAKTIDDEVTRLKARIKRFEEEVLPMREQRLRSQFIALEKAMATFQNQGNWLSGQVKGLASWNAQ